MLIIHTLFVCPRPASAESTNLLEPVPTEPDRGYFRESHLAAHLSPKTSYLIPIWLYHTVLGKPGENWSLQNPRVPDKQTWPADVLEFVDEVWKRYKLGIL